MANPIKYNTLTETRALNTGNFWIGTGDADKGPTSNTGYYVGPSVPSGGYVIYLYKDSQPGDLAYHIASNDSELISFTNKLASTSYTTVNECLNYFAGQDDKMVLNRDYEDIVTEGLEYNLDAGFIPSYPRNGTTWTDISANSYTSSFQNGLTYNTNYIDFDGTDDYLALDGYYYNSSRLNELSINLWFNSDAVNTGIIASFDRNEYWRIEHGGNGRADRISCSFNTQGGGQIDSFYNTFDLSTGTWYMFTFTYDNGDYKIYMDGIENNSGSAGTQLGTGGIRYGFLGIGSEAESFNGAVGPTTRYNGKIAIFQIYNKSLTSTEVLQNYNAQKSRFGL